MKPLQSFAVGAALLIATLAANTRAENLPPGQVDFGPFTPPESGGEFVEVNVPSNLIAMAARFVEKEDAEVAQVIKGVQSIRVNVIGLDDQNRAELEKRVQKVRKELDNKGWERIVTAQKQKQNVGVYLKTQGSDSVQGVAVVVLDGNKTAVFVNVVGNIRPEQLSMIGEKFHIEPLKKVMAESEK